MAAGWRAGNFPHRSKRRTLSICKDWVLRRAENLAYDVVGLPMALERLRARALPSAQTAPAAYLHSVYGDFFWRQQGVGGFLRILSGLILWPFGLPIAIALFTFRNGAAIRDRTGKSVAQQMREQIVAAAS